MKGAEYIMQDTMIQEKDNQTDESDNIKYQVLLASEEASCKLRNSVAGMSGTPSERWGPEGTIKYKKPM
jgi:hypothetical protein